MGTVSSPWKGPLPAMLAASAIASGNGSPTASRKMRASGRFSARSRKTPAALMRGTNSLNTFFT